MSDFIQQAIYSMNLRTGLPYPADTIQVADGMVWHPLFLRQSQPVIQLCQLLLVMGGYRVA